MIEDNSTRSRRRSILPFADTTRIKEVVDQAHHLTHLSLQHIQRVVHARTQVDSS